MTLNFASYPAFSSSIRCDDECGFGSWEKKNDFLPEDPFGIDALGVGRDWIDPVDLLPADPFGMELSSNLAAAIVGWFEDLGVGSGDCEFYCWDGDYGNGDGEFGCYGDNDDASASWFDDGFFEVFGRQVQNTNGAFASVVGDGEVSTSKEPEGIPHEGLMLSLGYLGIIDLLSVERVCRSLHSAIRNDPLLWRCVHVNAALSKKITDDALLSLTLKAQGSIQCLSLTECSRITDDGLRMVLEGNPKLQKLSISGCLRLTMEGVISNLKALKSCGGMGIKHLKLGRLFSVSPAQYEELQALLAGDEIKQQKPSKPRFYHQGISSIACKDDRALDIEKCPGCQKLKLVFDCPLESCRRKGPKSCRACNACIARCSQCGSCFTGIKFREDFLLKFVCSGCEQARKSKLAWLELA